MMATQRVTLAVVLGPIAQVLGHRMRSSAPDAFRIEPAVAALHAHSMLPPVVFFCEWIDLWSMGDAIPGLGLPDAVVVRDGTLEACCHALPIRLDPSRLGDSREATWLANRVTEAMGALCNPEMPAALLIVRQVLGPTLTDAEQVSGCQAVPDWLVGVVN